MKNMVNKECITGRVYEHNLQIKVGQVEGKATYGKSYITGDLSIAVDEEGLNVINVRYPCVMEHFNSGKPNSSFPILKRIIEEDLTWLSQGKENTLMIQAQPSIALRDFYDDEDKLVSYKVNEGGFVSTVKPNLAIPENQIADFTCDMFVTNVVEVEEKEREDGTTEEGYLKVKGAIFSYRKELLPTDFVVRSPEGIEYFNNMDVSPSEPELIKIKGKIVSETIVEEVKEELAFGGEVTYSRSKALREWRITGVFNTSYSFGEDEILTAEEVQKAMQDREIKLAEEKARSAEWKAQRNSGGVSQSAPDMGNSIPKGSFKFDY